MMGRRLLLHDLDQQIRDHIERETQDNIDWGPSPEEAHHAFSEVTTRGGSFGRGN